MKSLSNFNPNNHPYMKNQLIISQGGKGGVGKTVALLTLADLLETKNVTFKAIDADMENVGKAAAFSSYLDAESANLRSIADCDKLLTLAAENPVTLVDLPANSSGDLMPWLDGSITPEVLEELNLEIIALGAITPEAGSFASVVQWAGLLQDRASYIVALNHRFAARVPATKEVAFSEFYSSKIGKSFRESFDPKIIELPGLYEGSALLWARSGILPSAFAASTAPILDRTRVRSWIKNIHAQWELAGF